jgi:glycosyltransferase involved in cell wall biosynthesis
LDDASFSVVCSSFFCSHLKENIGLESPEHVHLNYHGLDPQVMARASSRQFKPPCADGVIRLVSVGRLVPTKGHDVVIKAIALLTRSTDLNLQLTLIGSGPLEQTLKTLALDEGVADRVEFTGGIAFGSVLDIMEASDLFCLAPRLVPGEPPDGIPNVIAEAMALRIPVVSTSVSAIPELIEDAASGHLVPTDDVEGFANAVETIASNPELAERFTVAGRKKVGSLFNQDQNIEDLIDLFKQYVPGAAVP